MVADSHVLCEGREQFRIFSEHVPAAVIAEKLDQHIIADDVIVKQLLAGSTLALVGAEAESALRSLGIQPTDGDGIFLQTDDLFVYSGRRSREPGFEIWSASEAVIEDLKARIIHSGAISASQPQIELMRINAGIPSIPIEIGPTDLPGEGGLVGDCVSLDKGCYLGQEVVARMHNVGRSQRALFLMSGTGEVPSCPVDLKDSASRNVGSLRSALSSEGGWLGVALLKKRYSEVGGQLFYEAGIAMVAGLFNVGEASDK